MFEIAGLVENRGFSENVVAAAPEYIVAAAAGKVVAAAVVLMVAVGRRPSVVAPKFRRTVGPRNSDTWDLSARWD